MSELIIKDMYIGDCPLCGGEMEHLDHEYRGDNLEDTYACDKCEVYVTYITPKDDGKEYREYSSIEVEIVRQ